LRGSESQARGRAALEQRFERGGQRDDAFEQRHRFAHVRFAGEHLLGPAEGRQRLVQIQPQGGHAAHGLARVRALVRAQAQTQELDQRASVTVALV
jgi:hypothetical protein